MNPLTFFLSIFLLSRFAPGPQVALNVTNTTPTVLTPQTTTSTNTHDRDFFYNQTNFNACTVASRFGIGLNFGSAVSRVECDTNVAVYNSGSSTIDYVSPGSITARIIVQDPNFNLSGFYVPLNMSTSIQETVTYTIDHFDPGSVAENVMTSMSNVVNGNAYSSALSALWSVRSLATTNYIRNPSCLFSNITGFPAIAAARWNSGVWFGQDCPTALSPRHLYFAAHVAPAANDLTAFVDMSNNVYIRKVLEATNVIAFSDMCIALLDQDLPASVGFLPVMPTNGFDAQFPYAVYSPTAQVYKHYPGIVVPQTQFVHINDFDISLGFCIYSTVAWYPSWGTGIVGGDSGTPMTLLINRQLLFISAWTSANSGPWISFHLNDINDAMAKISQRHGAPQYQLTVFDLSAFNSY